jgi:RNA polymerase sigma factor (sigma-70 family)
MTDAAASVSNEVNRLYKSHFGKMVSSLLYFSKNIDLETAEDIVQDAFASALTKWPEDGIPSNPAGWIFTVCRNKALNRIKQDERVRGLFKDEILEAAEPQFSESPIDDQQLKLLFSCAHPDLSPKVQVVITLKYVVNLKVESIAKILGMSLDGVDKMLLRARQKIRDEKILLAEPDLAFLKYRLPIVHKIIYLIFNEGYKSSWGKQIIREELCEDALLMNKALIESSIGNKETAALHSMMLFNVSRFKARFDATGALLDLEEQDRSLWNQDLIRYASSFMFQSQGQMVSSYHYEASIAYLHCTAKDFKSTDWHSISRLYAQLLQNNPNPFVEMNYAIALYYADQKNRALNILHGLQQKPFLSQYYLLNAALGKISFLEGDLDSARVYFKMTLRQTDSTVEKDYILKFLARMEEER